MKGLFAKGLLLCICLTALAFAGARELKEQIVGTWTLDESATLDHLKSQAKAKGKARAARKLEKKEVREFIRTHSITYRFQPNALTITEAGESQSYGLNVKRAAGKMIVFSSSRVDQTLNRGIQYSVYFVDDNHIVITSSIDESLSQYVWKRVGP